MKELDEQIETLIARKIASEISDDEQRILNNWLSLSAENQRYFLDLEKIYTLASKTSEYKDEHIDINREWQMFKSNVKAEKVSTAYSKSWLRLAASIVLITALSYAIWNSAFQSEEITVTAQYSGELISLPDNSVVTLNKDATIVYPKRFSKNERTVRMTGEAFFEVTRNENKPFNINLNQSNIEVLGTSFNVNADENSDKIEIVVNSGKVKFAITQSKESVILTKGEKGTLMKNNNLISKAQNNDVNFMAWRTRKIVFNDFELDEVIKTLNKLYDSQITFSTEVGMNCKVTVSFDNQSLDAILSVLELTLDLEYRKNGDIIEVVKTGC